MTEFIHGYPKIRRMDDRDLARVVELCHELGYLKADLKGVTENFRLGKNLESHEYYALVENERKFFLSKRYRLTTETAAL